MKLNKDRRIGKVLFIVEGENTEPKILEHIFNVVLGYRYTRYYRDGREPYEKFSSVHDEYSHVYVINAGNSSIKHIKKDNEYLNNLFSALIENYRFNFNNMAIYYIWDRDYCSNAAKLTRRLLKELINAGKSIDYNRQGMLLLSYPCIEAYTVSNFLSNSFEIRCGIGNELKTYLEQPCLKQQGVDLQNINDTTVEEAHKQLLEALNSIGVLLNLDNMREANTLVFDKQEEDFVNNGGYRLLSMLSVALIDLGLIN
jgi:hypothetical protein